MSNLVIAALRGRLSNPSSSTTTSTTTSSTKSLRFRTAGLASIVFVAAFLATTTTTHTPAAMVTTTNTVPARMHLTKFMKNSASWLSGAVLFPIDFAPSIGDVVGEETPLSGRKAVSSNAGPEGSICFVVRRPG